MTQILVNINAHPKFLNEIKKDLKFRVKYEKIIIKKFLSFPIKI